MVSWIDELTPAHVKGLDVYQPGKPIEELERELGISGAIKVASNENPLGPSPRVVAGLPAELAKLHLYPDAGGFALRRALATRYGVDLAQISLGNGSNDLLYQLVLALCGPDEEVLTHRYAFLSYRLAAQVAGRTFVAAPTTPELGCDVDALIAAFTPRTKLVVVGTPNNPTGTVLTTADAQKLLAALPAHALLVVDEAYAEFADAWPEVDHADGLALLAADRRVVVLRTFSKIYGLAGLRVGFALGDAAVMDVLGRVGRTFNVSSLALAGALLALDERAHVTASATQARAQITQLRAAVHGPGVKVYPSLANFVLIECGRESTPVYTALLKRGVIVRPMAAWGLPTCIRVSVARDEELPRVIAALDDVLA
ncbi:MAG: histidinol-phosphate transaminase [Proteobacteria bacterium]|nr:histidinol-phosphate transaminase [Pseudomonadota bacterium]